MPKPIEPISRRTAASPIPASPSEDIAAKPPVAKIKPDIGSIKNDDIILLIVIALLILNDCDDKLLLLALAYIFFSDRLPLPHDTL